MAARLAALALVCQLLLAAGVAAVLAFGFGLRTLPTVAATLAAFYGIALLLVAVPLAVAPRPDPEGRLHRSHGSAHGLLRSLAREALVFDLIWASMALEPFRASPIAGPDAAARRRPVLLVHGFACNRAVWRPFLERLSRAGFGPLRTVSLEPVFASVEACVGSL
ncbi:MAG TPA: hypothetical protein VHE11_00130, partial [Steroidobacteraceae bacterium]|nr:hypothetical protein [Steroidobacteraceae bacterium]